MHSPIIAPVVALVAWSLVIWLIMYATRLPAMARAGIDGTKIVGSNGPSLRADLIAKGENRASWVADNYNHLAEQPTHFYAIAISLALMEQGAGVNAMIAWTYAGLRIAHSLVQVTVNRVIVRFMLFTLSTLCLMALTLHATLALVGAHHL